LKFRAGDLEFNATIVDSFEFASPQTANMLRSLTIQFRAQKAGVHEAAVTEALERQSGGLYSLGASDEAETEWRVRESTWTYVGTEPYGMNHHVWRIEQMERLACTQLLVGPVTLDPYDYVESTAEAGFLRLAARSAISSDGLDQLSRLSGSLDVTRLGISDTPRQMRLSGYVWAERPDGLAVALACEDVREPRVTIAGFDSPAEADFEDLVALASVDREELRRRRHARRKVADVDAWSLQPERE
jgi:hypothetical protein